MPATLTNEKSVFSFEIISISAIDYRVFLKSDKPEERMFAILADFGKENPAIVVKTIAANVANSANGELEKERLKNQLRILAKLRTLVSINLNLMEPISSFIKEEEDVFFQRGEQNAEKKFVKNLLLTNRFTISEIVNFASVTEEFVQKVKDSLK